MAEGVFQMAIVQAGKQFTKDDITLMAGNLASMIVDHVQTGMDFGNQLASMTDADLVALGLTQDQVTAIKGFFPGELTPIANLIRDSFFLRSLIGLGA
jgi:hypothetical protein